MAIYASCVEAGIVTPLFKNSLYSEKQTSLPKHILELDPQLSSRPIDAEIIPSHEQ